MQEWANYVTRDPVDANLVALLTVLQQSSPTVSTPARGDFATQSRAAEAQALSKIRQPRQDHDGGHFRHPQQQA